MKILLAPHNDDEALFAAYTCIRENPLIVIATDSYVQQKRGDNISADQRRKESKSAADILSCDVVFLGIPDDEITHETLFKELLPYTTLASEVYAPARQGGHRHHDLCSMVAQEIHENVTFYTTYTKEELWTKGDVEVRPTHEEIELKNRALDCYKSQLRINRAHFDAVRGKSEWLIINT